MNTCRSCGAPLVWAKTEAGKAMPLDAEPSLYGGNIRLHDDGTITVLAKDDPRNSLEKLYKSHFATCRHARTHRKPR